MLNKRYLLAEATGDDLVEYLLVGFTFDQLGSWDRLMLGAKSLQKQRGESIDVTARGSLDLWGVYDIPESYPLFEAIEGFKFDELPMLLPLDFDPMTLTRVCGYYRIECEGIQVWPQSEHVRLTCYPKGSSYRVESRHSIHEALELLRKDWNRE